MRKKKLLGKCTLPQVYGPPKTLRLLFFYETLTLQEQSEPEVDGDPPQWIESTIADVTIGGAIVDRHDPPPVGCSSQTFLRFEAGAFRLAFPVQLTEHPHTRAVEVYTDASGRPCWYAVPFVATRTRHRAFSDLWTPVKPEGGEGGDGEDRRLFRQALLTLFWQQFFPTSYAEHDP